MSNYKYLQWRGELYRKKNNRAGISFAKKFYANLNHQLENSYKAARTLNELIKDPVLKNHPWWKPYLRHHQLQIWINYLGGAKKALPYCIDTLAMLEDPIYDGFPQRHCVINDLVSVYIAMDPTGYHDEINQKITDELAIMPDDMICRACYLRDRLDMYKYGGTVTDINDVVERLLLVYASSEHFGKCQKDRLFVSASQVCLHRREIDQAKTFFSQVSTDYIDSPYRKANYQTTKSRLELALNKNNPSKTMALSPLSVDS